MGGKVRYGIDKPPTILADPGQVRSIVIAGLQIFLQTQVILPLAIGQILCNREKLIDELLHLAVRQFDVGQVIDSLSKFCHVAVGKLQSFAGILHPEQDVFGVLCRPDTLCRTESQIQGVLADHPNRGHGDLDTRTAIMAVEEHKIWGHFVSGNDVLFRQLCQHPNLLATLQGACGFVGNTLAQQIVGELECFLVLHDAIAVRHHAENGIIEVVADCRASGHNGREGLDHIYKRLNERETLDFVEWAEYLKTLPYVNGDKIGVEGFSFGGTMTALLLMNHPDAYHYGIAGGGVYDWSLYDTHYTERFMDTPANNPEGYAETSVLSSAANYPVTEKNYDGSVMLKITHGTGDDNVHFQNTLLLVDALQKAGRKFELMIYPDGMHGYRGYQGRHFNEANRAFWLKYLKGE